MGLKEWWERLTGRGAKDAAGHERGFRDSSGGAGSVAAFVDTPGSQDDQPGCGGDSGSDSGSVGGSE